MNSAFRSSAALLAVVLVAAACGGGESEPRPTTAGTSTSTLAPFVTAAPLESGVVGSLAEVLAIGEGAEAPASARFEGEMKIVPGPDADVPGEISITFSGAYDTSTSSSEFSMDFGNIMRMLSQVDDAEIPSGLAELFADPIRIIAIGDTAWLKAGFFGAFFGVDDKWIETSAPGASEFSGGLGAGTEPGTPDEFLDLIAEAGGEITVVGTEEIRGVETTRVSAVLDLAALAGSLDAGDRARLEEQFGGVSPAFPIDLWIADGGLVYRFVMELDTASVGAPADDLVGVVMRYDVFDYGADVVISPPPANEVVTEDELGFSLEDMLLGP